MSEILPCPVDLAKVRQIPDPDTWVRKLESADTGSELEQLWDEAETQGVLYGLLLYDGYNEYTFGDAIYEKYMK